MSAAVAIATIAAVNSAAAEEAANQAQITACQSVMQTYDAAHASVPAMQTYAQCVELLHPMDTHSPHPEIGIAALIFFVVWMIIAVIFRRRDSQLAAWEAIAFSFTLTLGAAFALILLLALIGYIFGL
ncbi:MAG: hypothetical protein ACRC8G_03270 [Plesiomonas shigelloides]